MNGLWFITHDLCSLVGFSVTAERERCPTRVRWPESPHTTQTLCTTRRRPSSPTRCNITEGVRMSSYTLSHKHINTLHCTQPFTLTHRVKYTHPLAAIRTQRDSVIAALSNGITVEKGCRGSSFLPTAVRPAAAVANSTRGSSGAEGRPRFLTRVILTAVCRQRS